MAAGNGHTQTGTDSNTQTAPEPAAPLGRVDRSRLLVNFLDIGSANFSFHPENVNPMQMLALAAWLEWQGKLQLELGEIERQVRAGAVSPKIAIATANGGERV